jgi:hypothetical protein
MSDPGTIEVLVVEQGAVRGPDLVHVKALNVDDLTVNINVFLNQMNGMLEKTPEKVGKFQLAEFEVHAEISAKGTLTLLGTGGEAGATGGIKFLFRRPGG